MAKKLNKTVFVGVSGGVDSSVSAALLKDQGYDVVGVFIRTWQPDFIECTWRDERRDAMRVCAHLDIPFLECDGEEAYKKGVAEYMIEEYKKGNTPNPDVMCNREVKFGIFWKFAKERGADYIATGHYAQINLLHKNSSSRSSLFLSARSGAPTPVASQGLFSLRKSNDENKDQSYFLWTLTQDDLAHTLFPVGHLKKSQVRKLAEKYKLPTATKKDSQGVCFLGPLDMKDFLAHYIKEKVGDVLDIKGNKIGTHRGALFFTLGERHGFTITATQKDSKPYYVVSKDIKNNTITVSQENDVFSGPRGKSPDHSKTSFSCYTLSDTNWISGIPVNPPAGGKKYTAQIRYHGEQLPCKVEIIDKNNAEITFNNQTLVSKGQSIVLYERDTCIGGGVVV